MLRTAVRERSTRCEGIGERLPPVERSALPYVLRGDEYRGEDHTMRDIVLVGPGHCRAENHLDGRWGVLPIPNEDVCNTGGHLFLGSRPFRRGNHCSCTSQYEYAHQDCTYNERRCSAAHLDLSNLDGYSRMATSCSIKNLNIADSLVASTRGTT
jgi:hypothetical protein